MTVRDRTGGRQVPWSHYSTLPNRYPFRAQGTRPADGFEVLEVDRVMWVAGRSNARSGPGTGYDKVGSLRAGEEVTVTGEVGGKPWVQVEMPEGEVAYVHTRQLTGQAPPTPSAARAPGVYLTVDVSAGQRILPDHMRAVGPDRIPAGEIRDHAMVAGGCYAGPKRRAGGSSGPTYPRAACDDAEGMPSGRRRKGEGAGDGRAERVSNPPVSRNGTGGQAHCPRWDAVSNRVERGCKRRRLLNGPSRTIYRPDVDDDGGHRPDGPSMMTRRSTDARSTALMTRLMGMNPASGSSLDPRSASTGTR